MRLINEKIVYGITGVGVLAPLYMLLPAVRERMATQTLRWGPRWERQISRIAPPFERGVSMVEPRLGNTVKRMDHRLQPLERFVKATDRTIKRTVNKYRLDQIGRSN